MAAVVIEDDDDDDKHGLRSRDDPLRHRLSIRPDSIFNPSARQKQLRMQLLIRAPNVSGVG